MAKVLVIVPVPLDKEGVARRRSQGQLVDVGPDIDLDYRAVKVGLDLGDSYHDYLLGDLGVFEAAMTAQEEGYDAVCIDTMTDSGMNALRSVLDIPVIGPGRSSYLTALMLGNTFSVLTQRDPWIAFYKKELQEYGLVDKCASIRSINTPPDVSNLLGGKEAEVFPKLVEAGRQCLEDGADVICLGSTTMHQAHGHLTETLPVPVINPGPLTYKLAELLLGLGLTHSRTAYPEPHAPKTDIVRTMLDAAVTP